MNNKQYFLNLLSTLSGEELSDDLDKDSKILNENCKTLQEKLTPMLTVDFANGYEPCPFCFSGGERKAELVWVGLNPGSPLENMVDFTKENTWQAVVDFCAPTGGILKNGNNVYQYLVQNNKLTNLYYKTVFLVHQALVGDRKEVYDTWPAAIAKDAYGSDEKIAQAFLTQFDRHPILNAELIPYKSSGISYNGKKLMDYPHYKDYIISLLSLIIDKSNPDAYVVFYGAVKEVKKLLESISEYAPNKEVWKEEKLGHQSKSDKSTTVYFAPWKEKRTLVLMPFRNAYGGYGYKISELAKKLREFVFEKK